MKNIKPSTYKNKSTNKNINLSKIINSDLFFESSGLIKLALNKNRLVNKDFGIKRAKAKIDIGKKNKKNLTPNLKSVNQETKEEESNDNNIIINKKEIPFELADILENNKTKFKKVFEAFHDIKEKNEMFTSHWHYVQQSNERTKKKEKICFDKLKKDDFSASLKKYDFSTRDKIELDLQKKLTSKIFKSNPLMIKSNNDMLFYFLNMCKDKHINYKDQNTTKYLTKVKEILDYMQIFLDFKGDNLNKDVKVQNSNFLMKRKKKIEEENLKLKEDLKKQNIIDNFESKKMIKQTKKSLKYLNKNRNYFEDPYYFSNNYNLSSTFYKNNTSKFLTPSKRNVMSKSTCNFFIGDKHHFKYYTKYNTIELLQEKKKNLSKQLSALLDDENNKEQQKEKKLKKFFSQPDNINYNNIISLLQKNNNESYSKENTLRNSKSKNILNNIKIIQKKNKIRNKNKYNLDICKYLPSIKQFPYGHAMSPDADTFYQKKSNFSSIFSKKNDNSGNGTSKNNNDSSRLSKRKSLFNESNHENKKENEQKSRNKSFEPLNKKKLTTHDLYDIVKEGKKLNENDLKNISKFIYQKHKQLKNKKDTVNFIKEVQILSDGFDINKVCKSIETIPNKEIMQIRNFKKINGELNKLDKKYVREICEFKARNQRNDVEEIV